MVSINGVPSPQTTRSNQSQRAVNKQKATRKQTPKTTQVANAVRQRVDHQRGHQKAGYGPHSDEAGGRSGRDGWYRTLSGV